jgi:hypothetical protein
LLFASLRWDLNHAGWILAVGLSQGIELNTSQSGDISRTILLFSQKLENYATKKEETATLKLPE